MKKTPSKKTLTASDIKRLAELAKLTLTPEETQQFQKQLTAILEFVEKLNEVDTKNVEPTSQVTGQTNVFRDDLVEPSLTQEEALSNAPRTYNGFFMVDAVLEE